MSETLMEMAIRRVEEMELGYKAFETDGQAMTDAQVAEMNEALGLVKTGDYRPYCLHTNCRVMPRMALHPYGFWCWNCNNRIGFNLQRLP